MGLDSLRQGGRDALDILRRSRSAGEALKAHFPYQKDDINELSDDISFGGE